MIGQAVRHREHGWKGEVARYGHTENAVMVIWDYGGGQRGASVWPASSLEFLPHQVELFPDQAVYGRRAREPSAAGA